MARNLVSPRCLYNVAVRRIFLVFCVIFLIWGFTLINISVVSPGSEDNTHLQDDIIKMSQQYVKTLAKSHKGVVDGPYAGRFTGYDLKKTLAVLLDSLLGRIENLEQKLDFLINNVTAGRTRNEIVKQETPAPPPKVNEVTKKKQEAVISAKELIEGKQEECKLSREDLANFPHCNGKVEWMKSHWKVDNCYSAFGVDGSFCSIVIYLSEVESWCPKLSWRANQTLHNKAKESVIEAKIPDQIKDLLTLLTDPSSRGNYAWMRNRIKNIWSKWKLAAAELNKKSSLANRKQKRILVHIGALSKKSGFKLVENSDKGGPLGELLQWSDIVTSLYLLGHKLILTSEVDDLKSILSKLPNAKSQCQTRDTLPVDIIYTDIVGLKQFKTYVNTGYGKFSCLLRVVDSFGTEPAFNHPAYAKKHKFVTSWGQQQLIPQQFYTMFPHTPDNSFMGFVVDGPGSNYTGIAREKQAVVYGKHTAFWKDQKSFLDIVNEFLEIHATIYSEDVKAKANYQAFVPSYVKNHGLLSISGMFELLHQSKVFVGLGFPYEGPAPLEAIASGCVFLNPVFDPPLTSKNAQFFKGKPTMRELTSQHPYAEVFIGKPHVYTVNVNKPEEIREALKKILEQKQVEPYLPYEFTEEGMLQRLNTYIENQDFCKSPQYVWIPEEDITVVMSDKGKSCKETCLGKGLICEPTHFPRINNENAFRDLGFQCNKKQMKDDIFFPAIETDVGVCTLQAEDLLFSCVGRQDNFQRLCPCRNFIKGQTALCQHCV